MNKIYFTLSILIISILPLKADVVISNWDGYSAPDIMETFNAVTGITGEMSFHATNEEIMGKVTASGGKGYDVLFVSSPFAEALDKMGLLAKIDHSKIPNMKHFYKEAMNLDFDKGNKFQVPYAWGTTGLCYRSDLVSGTPSSWNDLLEPSNDLVGKITMLSTDRWLLSAGLLSLGYSVNETDPNKLNEAKAKLISAKKNLLAYDDTLFYAKLLSGEASMTHAWDGWCNYAIWENPDVKFVVPSEGSDLWVDTMVIMKSSSNKDEAHAFINYILDPAISTWTVENIMYKVPNKTAMEASAGMFEQFPNLGMSIDELSNHETLKDVGSAAKLYAKTVSEILSD
ncbi:MAG: polyamine ABC transporter substrate-binding protein [Candidatus Puniceispirillales bacterium]|jgi:spermidine/putrescine transport system substrate-binding protein|tara:strand:+ start:5668 stop:6693 length:1026 start_codon:yes stop_codon:yes gene_type:complete